MFIIIWTGTTLGDRPLIGRKTYNARTESVATKPSFRDAWKNAQHCISSSNHAPMGISIGVVTKYVGLAIAAGLHWQTIEGMDEATLERRWRKLLEGKPVSGRMPDNATAGQFVKGTPALDGLVAGKPPDTHLRITLVGTDSLALQHVRFAAKTEVKPTLPVKP